MQRVFVTGGSGSLGRSLILNLLSTTDSVVVCYSRDPHKQNELVALTGNHPNLRTVVGDVRDIDRLRWTMRGADVVVHAAALKHVDAGEYNPDEYHKTNIDGTTNVAEAAVSVGAEKCLFISSDKAVAPYNLYGRTKSVAERIWIRDNVLGRGKTKFSVLRYGNVFDSRGSVIQVWNERVKNGLSISVREPDPTRFVCFLKWGVDWIRASLELMRGGEIFLPAGLSAISMHDLALKFAPRDKWELSPLGGGEKQHESLIAPEEVSSAVFYPPFVIVNPDSPQWKYQAWENVIRLHASVNIGSEIDILRSSQNAPRIGADDFIKLYNQYAVIPLEV